MLEREVKCRRCDEVPTEAPDNESNYSCADDNVVQLSGMFEEEASKGWLHRVPYGEAREKDKDNLVIAATALCKSLTKPSGASIRGPVVEFPSRRPGLATVLVPASLAIRSREVCHIHGAFRP